jgi:hypothetical protein
MVALKLGCDLSRLLFPFLDSYLTPRKRDPLLLSKVVVSEGIGSSTGNFLQSPSIELQLQRISGLWHLAGELEVDELQPCFGF